METQKLKGLWIPAEILLRDSQKCLEVIGTNNYSASQNYIKNSHSKIPICKYK